jgi:hypothetical protein
MTSTPSGIVWRGGVSGRVGGEDLGQRFIGIHSEVLEASPAELGHDRLPGGVDRRLAQDDPPRSAGVRRWSRWLE